MITLHPHRNHKMQPPEIPVFGPFKTYSKHEAIFFRPPDTSGYLAVSPISFEKFSAQVEQQELSSAHANQLLPYESFASANDLFTRVCIGLELSPQTDGA